MVLRFEEIDGKIWILLVLRLEMGQNGDAFFPCERAHGEKVIALPAGFGKTRHRLFGKDGVRRSAFLKIVVKTFLMHRIKPLNHRIERFILCKAFFRETVPRRPDQHFRRNKIDRHIELDVVHAAPAFQLPKAFGIGQIIFRRMVEPQSCS